MELNEIKKSMSTLEQVLAKTTSEIKINVSASETAQTKILKNYRRAFVSCLTLALVFTLSAVSHTAQLSLPLTAYLLFILGGAGVWYLYLYRKLKGIDIAALTPSQLFSKTTNLKLLTLSGEIFFGACIVVLFTLILSDAWTRSPVVFWSTTATIIVAIILSIVYFWPRYINLFRALNSIKE